MGILGWFRKIIFYFVLVLFKLYFFWVQNNFLSIFKLKTKYLEVPQMILSKSNQKIKLKDLIHIQDLIFSQMPSAKLKKNINGIQKPET